jgi:hypothetical protein
LLVVLAAGCAGSGDHPNASNLHHHYFLVGKRTCADLLRHSDLQPSHLKGITVWHSFVTATASVNTVRIPKPHRQDAVAGCNAAA